jgi:tetratricopeptide (TPR) repeat protein
VRTVFSILFVFKIGIVLFSQEIPIKKADKLYKEQKYTLAIPHLEKVVAAKPSANAYWYKLAYSYRMVNKMDKAGPIWEKLVLSPKVQDMAWYYLGESLITQSRYEEAKKAFLAYEIRRPEDPRGAKMAASCDQIPAIKPKFPYVWIDTLSLNSNADDNGAVLFGNSIVFTSDRPIGAKLIKEKSGWTGRDFLRIYKSDLKSDGSIGEVENYGSKLNSMNLNTGFVTFPKNGESMIFTRNGNTAVRKDMYTLQLFETKKSGSQWASSDRIGFCNLEYNYMHPSLSADGNILIFASDKPGGFGGLDLYISERNNQGWSKPLNLGEQINTPGNDAFPNASELNLMDRPEGVTTLSGKLIFCSDGHPGYGSFDIFETEKISNGDWFPPRNLGQPINGPSAETSFCFEPNTRVGYFTSSRMGGQDDIYRYYGLTKSADTYHKVTLQFSKEGKFLDLDQFEISVNTGNNWVKIDSVENVFSSFENGEFPTKHGLSKVFLGYNGNQLFYLLESNRQYQIELKNKEGLEKKYFSISTSHLSKPEIFSLELASNYRLPMSPKYETVLLRELPILEED